MFRAALTFGFLLFLAPTLSYAQSCGTENLISGLIGQDRARLDALVAPHPYPTGNFWTAKKDGSTVTVVGTIHIPDPRLDAYVERVRPALDAADLLILEASQDAEAGVQALATQKPELFFITEGPTLIELLGDEDWARVSDQLQTMGIPGFFAAQFQPWYLSLTLALPPCAMTAMLTGEAGLDRRLELIANENGTDLATLDDIETVLRIFADEPLEDQLNGLRITLETQTDPAATSTMIESYFDERVRESWEFGRLFLEQAGVENGAEMFEDLNASLLVGRNMEWEPKIAALVEGKDVVLAVGAAHLSGEDGVLRALERAGYTLSPMAN